LDLQDVNVLVGGNNSGKSSIIQGLHFGVALLQTIGLTQKWTVGKTFSTSVGPNQLIYSPSEDAYALGPGGKLVEDADQAIRIHITLRSGEECAISVRKGRNRNILVAIENPTVAQTLANLETPFSIFSPGLAGIVKRETYVSDGVLFRALARGDANLVLRNILLRLWNTPAWEPFLGDLRNVFSALQVQVHFNDKTDEFIEVKIRTGNEWVPLEVAGTGVLQATQILSYIHRFAPPIIVLDEPDSHLHPNNQRLLCALLRLVAEERGTQVVLTTHSRHVVDAIGESTGFFWVRNGTVDVAGPEDELGILMDIGALDVKERVGQSTTKAVILTEDELTHSLELILESSGFDLASSVVLPYYGVTQIKNLQPLVRMIQSTNPKAKLILHRDRDFLTQPEVDAWKIEVRKLSVEPFVTNGRDIESYFINGTHLAMANPGTTEEQLDALISEVIALHSPMLLQDYVNWRLDHMRKSKQPSPNPGAIAVEAQAEVMKNPVRFAGKSIFRAIKSAYHAKYGKNMTASVKSEHLKDMELAVVARKTFKN
jgi:hypothetical protein